MQQRRLNLRLAVRLSEDPETVLWAVLGPDGQPGVMGTFPRLPGPPVNTVQAISEMLADLMDLNLAAPPQRVETPAAAAAGMFRKGDPNLN